MTDQNDLNVTDLEQDMVLLIAIALEAYSVENGEVFSVSNTIVNDLILRNVKEGTVVPSVKMDTSTGRLEIEVQMLEPTSEQKEQYPEAYGD